MKNLSRHGQQRMGSIALESYSQYLMFDIVNSFDDKYWLANFEPLQSAKSNEFDKRESIKDQIVVLFKAIVAKYRLTVTKCTATLIQQRNLVQL